MKHMRAYYKVDGCTKFYRTYHTKAAVLSNGEFCALMLGAPPTFSENWLVCDNKLYWNVERGRGWVLRPDATVLEVRAL